MSSCDFTFNMGKCNLYMRQLIDNLWVTGDIVLHRQKWIVTMDLCGITPCGQIYNIKSPLLLSLHLYHESPSVITAIWLIISMYTISLTISYMKGTVYSWLYGELHGFYWFYQVVYFSGLMHLSIMLNILSLMLTSH